MQWKAQIVAFGAILSRYEICWSSGQPGGCRSSKPWMQQRRR